MLCTESGVSAPFQSHSPTSREAAESIAPDLGRLEQMVFDALRGAGTWGRTCDELEVLLDMKHQTASARLIGVEQQGAICKLARTRLTRSGRNAAVYVIKADRGDQPLHEKRSPLADERAKVKGFADLLENVAAYVQGKQPGLAQRIRKRVGEIMGTDEPEPPQQQQELF